MHIINVLLTTPAAATVSLHLAAPPPGTPITAADVLAAAPPGVAYPFTYLLVDGRAVAPAEAVVDHGGRAAAVAAGPLHVTARHRVGILGGKGGFGAQLRGATASAKTTNFDSCRDLRGRRLRDVVAERAAAAARAGGGRPGAGSGAGASAAAAAGGGSGAGGDAGGGGGGEDADGRGGKRRRVEVRVDFDEDALDEECHTARRRARDALYAGLDAGGGAPSGDAWGGGAWGDDESSSGEDEGADEEGEEGVEKDGETDGKGGQADAERVEGSGGDSPGESGAGPSGSVAGAREPAGSLDGVDVTVAGGGAGQGIHAEGEKAASGSPQVALPRRQGDSA